MAAALQTVVVYNARYEGRESLKNLIELKKVKNNGKVYRTKNENRPPLW